MRRAALLPPLALMLSGCWSLPTEVTLTGAVLDEYQGAGFEGATVEIHTPLGEPWGSTTTGADGSFSVGVPASSAFFATLSAEGHVPTSFTGIAGSEDVVADEGTLYLRSEAEVAALRAEFAACPAAQDEGPLVEGVVRLYLGTGDEPEDLPTITNAKVTVYDAQDQTWTACYLDDDGVSLADGTETGNTGRFAVFGVPEGPLSVAVEYDLADDYPLTYWNIVRGAPGGAVPMYPAWVGLE